LYEKWKREFVMAVSLCLEEKNIKHKTSWKDIFRVAETHSPISDDFP
jgi:hypothetical protein